MPKSKRPKLEVGFILTFRPKDNKSFDGKPGSKIYLRMKNYKFTAEVPHESTNLIRDSLEIIEGEYRYRMTRVDAQSFMIYEELPKNLNVKINNYLGPDKRKVHKDDHLVLNVRPHHDNDPLMKSLADGVIPHILDQTQWQGLAMAEPEPVKVKPTPEMVKRFKESKELYLLNNPDSKGNPEIDREIEAMYEEEMKRQRREEEQMKAMKIIIP